MSILKNLIKKSKIYSFLNCNFSNLEQKIRNLEDITNNLIKNTNDLKLNQDLIKNTLSVTNNNINIIENRTKQFDFINSELLLLQNNKNKQQILIVGFYGAPNSGDELMLQSILEKIDTEKYSITIMLADNPNYKIQNYKNINFIHYPKTNMDINILANYFDKVIFGGGALIEDNYFLKDNSYKYNTASILISLSIACILNNKKVYAIGLSASNKLTNQDYISKLDFIIENSEYFSLRDTLSLETLKNSGINNLQKISIIHDLVFSLKPTPYDFDKIYNSAEFIIGLVLISSADKEKLKQLILWIDEYSKQINKTVKIKLIPFYDFCNADIFNLSEIINELNLSLQIELLPYFQQYEDIINIFNQCNIIINMRYHSSLLSLKSSIPSIHIIYDMHPHYTNKMNYLKNIYMLPDLFLYYQNLNKKDFLNCLDYAINHAAQLNLLESIVSSKIMLEAQEQHTTLINNIVAN